MSLGFSFNGKHSKEFNIYMKSKSRPLLAQKRISEEVIPNRNGSIKFEDGYGDKIIEIDCTFIDSDLKLRRQILREIASWLSQKGKLIFDDEPDKYYEARIGNQIDFEVFASFDTFTLIFICEPMTKSVYINESVTLEDALVLYSNMPLAGLVNTFPITAPQTVSVTNLGTYNADLIIEIDGTADIITFENKGKTFTIENITEKTYVDCANLICYTINGSGNKINKLMDFEGDFIELEKGENNITILGTNLNVSVFFNYRNTYL